jgi:glycosyltransferase involved in cell wall biosynthesis
MKLASTINQYGDGRPELVHWIPTSALGGLEVALLTFLREAPELEHTIVTGEASGPMADLWRASGATVIETPEWWEFLGISWASRWSGFVHSRPLSRLIIWSPTRLNLILRPLSPEIRCVVHLGSVGALGFKARLFERMSALFNQSGCRPLLIACSVAAKKTAVDEPMLANYDCVVGYNAARPEYFVLGSANIQQGRQRRMWGMVARLDVGKGQSLILKAWALLPREFGLRLCLVGGGPREAALRQEAHELGLAGIVDFTGAVPDPSVIMKDWDGFVFATTAGEGFGIAVAEAMAAGLPCVVTDVPALREMAEDAALYVRPNSAGALADAIMSIVKDPDFAANLSSKARYRAAGKFAPSAFGNAYKQALGLLRP